MCTHTNIAIFCLCLKHTLCAVFSLSDDNNNNNTMNEFPTWEVRVDSGRRWSIALLQFGLQFFVFLLLASFAVGKIIEFGFYAYIQHFTNWSWSLQIFFYFATLAVPFLQVGLLRADGALGRFSTVIVVSLFFLLNGIVWVVVVVVSVLLGTNSPFLTDVFEKLPPTIVMLGNDVFHFWPLIFILVFYIFYYRYLFFAMNRALNATAVLRSPVRTTIFIVYQAYFATGFALLAYSLLFDPHEVYKTDVWTGGGILVAFLALTVFNLAPLMSILHLLRVGTNVQYSLHWLIHNEYDPQYDSVARPDYHADLTKIV